MLEINEKDTLYKMQLIEYSIQVLNQNIMHLSMQSPTTPLPGQGGGFVGALLVKPSPGGGNFVKSVYHSCFSVY